jgi:hypothetical protein
MSFVRSADTADGYGIFGIGEKCWSSYTETSFSANIYFFGMGRVSEYVESKKMGCGGDRKTFSSLSHEYTCANTQLATC